MLLHPRLFLYWRGKKALKNIFFLVNRQLECEHVLLYIKYYINIRFAEVENVTVDIEKNIILRNSK